MTGSGTNGAIWNVDAAIGNPLEERIEHLHG